MCIEIDTTDIFDRSAQHYCTPPLDCILVISNMQLLAPDHAQMLHGWSDM